MKSAFTADFVDGGKKIKIRLSQYGVSFSYLHDRSGKEFSLPWEVAFRTAVKLAVAGEKKNDKSTSS